MALYLAICAAVALAQSIPALGVQDLIIDGYDAEMKEADKAGHRRAGPRGEGPGARGERHRTRG